MGTSAPRIRRFMTMRGAEIIGALRLEASLPFKDSLLSQETVES
jgi:hypothetical protein